MVLSYNGVWLKQRWSRNTRFI